MVCESYQELDNKFKQVDVLILVLVEDGLRDSGRTSFCRKNRDVLILVLVEDGLREWLAQFSALDFIVLILVLVEDGLRELQKTMKVICRGSLNPCFSGRWSARNFITMDRNRVQGLNPCFSGRWSARPGKRKRAVILLHCLNPCFSGRWSARQSVRLQSKRKLKRS